MAHARDSAERALIPAPADHLRILLGHALFQRRELDLCQLLILWDLMDPTVVATARAEAQLEGWQHGFDAMMARAEEAVSLLKDGRPIKLPVPPPALPVRDQSRWRASAV
jgi:hypothetical protein